jgi:pyruvate dehydrogenase complex dehydrogenase (E1) component
VVAALDYVSAVGLSIAPWVARAGCEKAVPPLPLGEGSGVRAAKITGDADALTLALSQRERGPRISSYVVLGADGFGRSEARKELRRFFEVDAENIALAALVELARDGKYPNEKLAAAIKTLGLDPNKMNPVAV